MQDSYSRYAFGEKMKRFYRSISENSEPKQSSILLDQTYIKGEETPN